MVGRLLNTAVLAAFISLAGTSALLAQPDPSLPPIVLKKRLSPRLHMLKLKTKAVVNTVISTGPDGVLMVDHPGRRTVDPVKELLTREMKVPDIGLLISTHWHPDHTSGNVAYGPSVPIIAHRMTLEAMSTVQHPPWAPGGVGPAAEAGWPSRTFEDSMELEFNGETIELHYYGDAHSKGDTIVYFTRSNVVCMGDVGIRRVGVDPEILLRIAGAIIEKMPPDAWIVRGHNSLIRVSDLEKDYQMLKSSFQEARSAVASGRSLEEFRDAGLSDTLRSLWAEEADERIGRWLASLFLYAKQAAGAEVSAPPPGS